jgi:DNA-binding MarR family transcriptional regulator
MTGRPEGSHRAVTPEVVADRLHSAAIHVLRRVRRTDEATGITPVRLSALSVLVFGGPMTLGELAAAEQVRPPTMSRLVRALEAEGLVQREIDRADKRVIRLTATEAAVDILHQGQSARVAALAAQVRQLPPDDQLLLARAAELMERLARNPSPLNAAM